MNKSKQTKLSEEEIALFRASCKGIEPLAQSRIHLTEKTKPIKIRAKKPPAETYFYQAAELNCSAEDPLYFARPGLQNKILNQLKRGQIKIEARLDLHRLIGAEALETTQNFLENAQRQGYKWLLIIHGKGHYSKEGKPVLKNLLNHWLAQQAAVLAFASSQPRHGGTGALYVLLKRENYA